MIFTTFDVLELLNLATTTRRTHEKDPRRDPWAPGTPTERMGPSAPGTPGDPPGSPGTPASPPPMETHMDPQHLLLETHMDPQHLLEIPQGQWGFPAQGPLARCIMYTSDKIHYVGPPGTHGGYPVPPRQITVYHAVLSAPP